MGVYTASKGCRIVMHGYILHVQYIKAHNKKWTLTLLRSLYLVSMCIRKNNMSYFCLLL